MRSRFFHFYRIACLTVAWAALAGHPAQAAGPTEVTSAPAAASSTAFRDLPWEELVPKDWDPLKQFQGLNLSTLKDNDPEAAKLLKQLRTTWDNAPTNKALAGARIRIPGFLVPLEQTSAGVKEFLLVPYFGACIHSPPPPANQIIHVLPNKPVSDVRTMSAVWVTGTLALKRSDNEMGVSGYQLSAVKVEPYAAPPAPKAP
ncbi:MAG: DUF3299 domain-containing protein [Pseudomonadota bacterium]